MWSLDQPATWTPDTIQAMLVGILTAATILVGALIRLVSLFIQLREQTRLNGSSMERLRQEVQQALTTSSNGTDSDTH